MKRFWTSYQKLEKSLSRSPDDFVRYHRENIPQGIQVLDASKFSGSEDKDGCTIRFVVISDTHNRSDLSEADIPAGDVLLHCGDATMRSMKHEFSSFNSWIGTLPHPTKIVIAGNHDRLLEVRPLNAFFSAMGAADREGIMEEFTNYTYIEDESVSVHGYNIYGSPWTPVHLGGFQKNRGTQMREKWEKIPTDTDILLTHGPPAGVGDKTKRDDHAGCVDLLQHIQTRVKPLYHCFGHIHEGNGVYSDGQTTYMNAAICNISYKAVQPAYVFDLPVRGNEGNGLPPPSLPPLATPLPPPYLIDSGGSDEESEHSSSNDNEPIS